MAFINFSMYCLLILNQLELLMARDIMVLQAYDKITDSKVENNIDSRSFIRKLRWIITDI
jgi:peroxiredoxin